MTTAAAKQQPVKQSSFLTRNLRAAWVNLRASNMGAPMTQPVQMLSAKDAYCTDRATD